jgi:hypothetical protein
MNRVNLRVSQVNGFLLKNLPGQTEFVGAFMKDRGHGVSHGREVLRIAGEQVKLGGIALNDRDWNCLEWAGALHDIADVKSPEEYRSVFAAYKVDSETIAPVLSGLSEPACNSVNSEIAAFQNALEQSGKLRHFHHLTAAVFAFTALSDVLGPDDARLTAQAILLHSERDLTLFPQNPVVRLFRDSDKIEGLDMARLIDINIKAGRVFFDPAIPFSLREEIIRGGTRPEDQESREAAPKLDTFQFAGIRSLMLDTNPAFYANPQLAGIYLERHAVFEGFLKDLIRTATEHDQTVPLLKENLETLVKAFDYASTLTEYAALNAQLLSGSRQLEGIIAGC